VEAIQPSEPVYERLAYEAAQRALDKQERLIDELRSRTGLLLAAASLAASFFGREAFAGHPKSGLAILALTTFPGGRRRQCLRAPPEERKVHLCAGLYEGLYNVKDDLADVYRRLAYDLDRFWEDNDVELQKLFRAFRVAALGLSAEIVILIAMVSDNLF
jgi:hypothetical protein